MEEDMSIDNITPITKNKKPGITKYGTVSIGPDNEIIVSGFEFHGVDLVSEAPSLAIAHTIKVLTECYHGIN